LKQGQHESSISNPKRFEVKMRTGLERKVQQPAFKKNELTDSLEPAFTTEQM
jgi:hypothetical protein